MKLLIDENISYCIVDELRKKKFDVESVSGKYSGFSDKEIYNKAIKEERIIITRDHHFSNSFRFPPGKTKGIVYIRYGNLTSNDELQIVVKFINSDYLNKINGKFVTLYKNQISIQE